jgi:hypothetical protein
MMWLIAAAAAASATPTPTPAVVSARVFVRIERPALASAQEWNRASSESNRRERLIRDERGELQLQRVFEYE